MNQNQKQQALKILAKDCQIDCFYLKGHKTCAIGALAIAAGVRRKVLSDAVSDTIDATDDLDYPERAEAVKIMRKAIRSKFGLTIKNMSSIQSANDSYSNREERLKAVLETVRKIKTTK